MQSPIHEGYEYQDYFTVSIILQLMIQQIDAELIIDRKDFSGDKFDDLKLKMSNGNIEFQIKYSDDESSHKLTKDDLANGNGHDTALCDLFASWKMRKESENDTQIKLRLVKLLHTGTDLRKYWQTTRDKLNLMRPRYQSLRRIMMILH